MNAFDADCAVITSIDLDHGIPRPRPRIDRAREGRHHAARQAGDRQRSDGAAQRDDEVARVGAELWLFGRDFNYAGDRQQWAWGGAASGAYKRPGLSGACAGEPIAQCGRWLPSRRCAACCRSRRRRCATASRWSSCRGASRSSPASRRWCSTSRTTRIPVAALAQNLDQMGFHPRTHAVFGAMRDKDLAAILTDGAAGRQLALHRSADRRAARADELLRNCSRARPEQPGAGGRRIARPSPPQACRCRRGGRPR